ncbi:MAG: YceI family protein [Hyphomonadaceae bacterium]
MRLSALTFVLALAACASTPAAVSTQAVAQQPGIAQAAPTHPVDVDLPAGTYALDPRHSSVQFRIRHMNVGFFVARFGTRAATLTLDPDDPARSTLEEASDEPDSVNTGVLDRNGERTFDRQMAEAIGGGTIRFTSTAIARTGRYSARVTGDLSMNGRPIRPRSMLEAYNGGRTDPLRGGNMALGLWRTA